MKEVFRNHARCGDDESQNLSDIREQCYKRIESRVLYNLMVYMGVCGGAVCAGKHYWMRLASGGLGHHLTPPIAGGHNNDLKLFDFCMGLNLHYEALKSPNVCMTKLDIISPTKLMITSGAGLAVHIEAAICEVKSFQCTKNNTWWEWCEEATRRHRHCIQHHAATARTGPWYHPTVARRGIWYCLLNGTKVEPEEE